MTARSPSLAEQWFVDDAVLAISRLCPLCRAKFQEELRLFHADDRAAFHEIYRQSRAIRVMRVMQDDIPAARKIDDWEVLRVLRTIRGMIGLGAAVFAEQRGT